MPFSQNYKQNYPASISILNTPKTGLRNLCALTARRASNDLGAILKNGVNYALKKRCFPKILPRIVTE
jgi:hypothetical protein